MSESIIKVFFHMTLTIKLYHWQTKVYARHKASDDLFNELQTLIDTFVEVYIGKYKRPEYNEKISITFQEVSDDDIIKTLNKYVSFLIKDLPQQLQTQDTELLNIRDEMLQLFNKTLYLFTLH
jgi:DNA-binding ferritin-like protein